MIASTRTTSSILIVCSLLILYVGCLSAVEDFRITHDRAKNNIGIWSLPPSLLAAITSEFKGITATYLTMEAGARLGTKIERKSDGGFIRAESDYNCQTINEIFKASLYLDPSFQQTYILAQGWLPWDCGLVQETMEILKTAKKHRPWDWQPSQFMSFNSYYFLNNNSQAGHILLDAVKNINNTPAYFTPLGTRLIQKGGETATAISLLNAILEDKNPADPEYVEINQRLEALKGVLLLEQAVHQYSKRYGGFPDNIENMLSAEILEELPNNPYNLPYCVNQNGIIFFDRPNCRDQKEPPTR